MPGPWFSYEIGSPNFSPSFGWRLDVLYTLDTFYQSDPLCVDLFNKLIIIIGLLGKKVFFYFVHLRQGQ